MFWYTILNHYWPQLPVWIITVWELVHLQGLQCCRTTAYCPYSNRLVIRQCTSHVNHINWTEALPLVFIDMQAVLKTDLKCSTAELVYRTTLHLPGEFFDSDPSLSVSDQQSMSPTSERSCHNSEHPSQEAAFMEDVSQTNECSFERGVSRDKVHIWSYLIKCDQMWTWLHDTVLIFDFWYD